MIITQTKAYSTLNPTASASASVNALPTVEFRRVKGITNWFTPDSEPSFGVLNWVSVLVPNSYKIIDMSPGASCLLLGLSWGCSVNAVMQFKSDTKTFWSGGGYGGNIIFPDGLLFPDGEDIWLSPMFLASAGSAMAVALYESVTS